ncbi:MAG: flagellar biosynthesis protein FliC [Cellvibrionaceae bacterium]|nr:flagellar biosynthesis protein FliC [Cellvibrionaceae bacterium]
MPLVINTNVSSLNAQRQLVRSGQDLDQAMERLSSGKRVNTAADDAAGLAISNRMTSQIKGLDQAIRNANDGVSMIQTAEGALDEVTNILQRMRELAIQAANGIYSDVDRATLDAEVQQLKSELDRIAESTSFNGQPLLDGSQQDVTLQVGSEATDTIAYSISSMNTDTLGGGTSADVVGAVMTDTITNIATAVDATDGILSINGQNVGSLAAQTDLGAVLDTINAAVSGVEVSSFLEITATADGDGVLRNGAHMDITLVNLDGEQQAFDVGESGTMEELVDRINEITGGTVKASLNADERLVLTSSDAQTITIGYTGDDVSSSGIGATTYFPQLAFEITDDSVEHVNIAITGSATTVGTLMEDLGLNNRTNSTITTATLVTTTSSSITEGDIAINGVALSGYTAGTNAGDNLHSLVAMINGKSDEHGVVASTTALAASTVGATLILNSVDNDTIAIDLSGTTGTYANTGLVEINNTASFGDTISSVKVDTIDDAQAALNVIDSALETINTIRADLGAINNRLEFTMSNLANVVENTAASRSRIIDADFAAESAMLSRAQVLQQASQAMLAQANARPQQVLQLLQG